MNTENYYYNYFLLTPKLVISLILNISRTLLYNIYYVKYKIVIGILDK